MHGFSGKEFQPVRMEGQYTKVCGGVRMVSGVGVFSNVAVGRPTQLGIGAYRPALMFQYPML